MSLPSAKHANRVCPDGSGLVVEGQSKVARRRQRLAGCSGAIADEVVSWSDGDGALAMEDVGARGILLQIA